MKDKLILDAGVFALLLLCMLYGATGPLLHEIIGIVLIIGLIIHLLINRKYYNILKSGKISKTKLHTKISFVLNIILPVSLLLMLSSSIIISKDIFSFLNIETNNYEIWRIIHIISALVMLVTSFTHLLMHLKLFKSLGEKYISGKFAKSVAGTVSSITALLIGIYVIRCTSDQLNKNIIKPSNTETEPLKSETEIKKENTETLPVTEEYTISEAEITEALTQQEEIITEEPEPDKLSLEEYLGNLICTGCGKRCSLLNPRCGKGERQAKEATAEYESLY